MPMAAPDDRPVLMELPVQYRVQDPKESSNQYQYPEDGFLQHGEPHLETQLLFYPVWYDPSDERKANKNSGMILTRKLNRSKYSQYMSPPETIVPHSVTKRGPACMRQCIMKRLITVMQCHYLC